MLLTVSFWVFTIGVYTCASKNVVYLSCTDTLDTLPFCMDFDITWTSAYSDITTGAGKSLKDMLESKVSWKCNASLTIEFLEY